MRNILYAGNIKLAEGEEQINSDAEQDEKFLDRIMDDYSWARGFYNERDDEFDRMEKWYFRDHYEDPEPETADVTTSRMSIDRSSNIEDEHLVTINKPFSSVQRAHMLMTSEQPVIEDMNHNSASEKVQQFLHSAMWNNQLRQGSHPMHDAIFNQLLYGWGVLRTTWARNQWEDPDSSFAGDRPPYDFPIKVESLHPSDVYPIPGGIFERWQAVIHRTRKSVREVNDEWEVELHGSDTDLRLAMDRGDEEFDVNAPLNPDMDVDVIDYWAWHGNSIIHAVVAHEQFVMRPAKMTKYDGLPFTVFFCGATTHPEGKNMGLSINYALVDSVAEMEWLINRHMRIVERYAEPITVIERVNDEAIQTNADPGATIELVEGERAYYLQFSGTLPDLSILQDFFRQMADEEGFALPRDAGAASGIQTIAEQQAALIKIYKPVENAELAWENVNFKIIGLLQRFSWDKAIELSGRIEGNEGERSETFSFKYRGSQTKGHRSSKVTLRAKFPLEELRYAAVAATLKNSGLMPSKMIMQKLLGMANPTEARRMIRREMIEDDPNVAGALIQDQLALIAQRSAIMNMVAEEVEGRGQPSADGLPQSPANLMPQQGVMEQLMSAVGNASMGSGDDSGPPLSQENPVDNLELGGQGLA